MAIAREAIDLPDFFAEVALTEVRRDLAEGGIVKGEAYAAGLAEARARADWVRAQPDAPERELPKRPKQSGPQWRNAVVLVGAALGLNTLVSIRSDRQAQSSEDYAAVRAQRAARPRAAVALSPDIARLGSRLEGGPCTDVMRIWPSAPAVRWPCLIVEVEFSGEYTAVIERDGEPFARGAAATAPEEILSGAIERAGQRWGPGGYAVRIVDANGVTVLRADYELISD